ncbi:NAD-dependent epimerase/dehydratase family protein [Streptomyces litchfieldiae]|uniref:NAD-dependent epimerase/dehydratase family protein n=1 Tax=Streptomyces litchfieldiae TaxID=3075543 RepID=A0ABU2MK18_9ACTN|nr:NAD-dependent epimerase/dehydratase family protein [Streptomyces sp. DSM 44938]MDT0341951.1 NAD-dependent epimerase/dehydratase family protein [Streptomyces sp. DSM 44938]
MRIFLTGATGYIGGSLAVRLLQAGHHVRGLTRSPGTLPELRARGIDPVAGSLDDARLLAEEARAADAVINTADSDHASAVGTFIEALAGSGKPLLHTSGSSIVGEASNGTARSEVYREADIEEGGPWQPAPEKAPRVAIDRRVLSGAAAGVRSVVLCNSMIYGTGTGLHTDSVQIPRLVATARETGVVRHIGPGENIWSNVHIDDVCDLYLRALEGAKPGSFYFVENGESDFRQITGAIATALRLPSPQPWGIDEAIAAWGYEPAVYALGSNSRIRGEAPRAELDWRPVHISVTEWILQETR